jgi:hypothetical protein
VKGPTLKEAFYLPQIPADFAALRFFSILWVKSSKPQLGKRLLSTGTNSGI